ncbi:coiled-coil domain-containing protein 25 [Tetranychus urticae]|uniref:Coiled-coil domain-containing protein 25 n=2 Tax=Tetranychus urticae TaxID=32264 RepID=T1KC80_TETUR|nr:coiled-coil domain-containing protein 25-like [Tetranychus urticae]XP_015794129.1 coiled-coil domain-containing protein 25 [Tetranychus urticae]
MVIYFKSEIVSPPMVIYMGVDKYENEELIKWGWPEDVWFHVDKVSSAHVYLRLRPGQTLDDVPSSVLDDCAQLVKANSIEGNKMNDVDIVYTMWSNLKKTKSMDVGQVGFFSEKQVRKMRVEKRCNAIVNRLNKTKETREEDLQALKEERDRQERDKEKAKLKKLRDQEKEEAKKRQEAAKARSYEPIFKPELMKTNKDNDSDGSDDFM